MKPDLSTQIGSLKLKNPVMVASGTFGCGEEFQDFMDIGALGALVVKTITMGPTKGNPMPRIIETTAGMLNSIGLQNEGVDDFINNKIPIIKEFGVPVIVNIAGKTVKEYKELAQILDKEPLVSALEVNISCPNVKEGGLAFGTDPKWTNTVIKNVCTATEKMVITKLSPNVTNIVKIAEAAADAGTDALSLINTFKGMAIDINKKRPVLATVTGGLSGPCIKPIALRMVWEVAKAVKLPVIGIGGITCWEDAIEFMLAGASAISVGTANFIKPDVTIDIINGIEKYLEKNNIKSVKEIIGALNE